MCWHDSVVGFELDGHFLVLALSFALENYSRRKTRNR